MEAEHFESLYPAKTREKEIARILSFLKEGKSCQLIALPGVGRGNCMGFLAYNRNVRIHHLGEDGQFTYHFVLCNFSEMRNRSLFDVMKFLFLELSSSLHERNREEEFLFVDALFKDALSYHDELVLFQELKKAIDYLTLEKKLSVTFLLERFETYTNQVEPIFFSNLRSLRARAKYLVNFVFSTTRPLEDMLDNVTLADFYEFIADNHIYLPLFDVTGTMFRISYLEKLTKKILPEKLKQNILDLTAGHGKLTRLTLEHAFAQSTMPETITQQALLQIKTITGALTEIWEFLIPDEQQDLLAISIGSKDSISNEFLQKIGLIKETSIAIPLFDTFVQQKSQEKKRETITYNQTTNTIQKGQRVISDTLTQSEFRLLSLLLQHANEIVDKETMITSVWSDTKTQAGVSDQALDQLLFRLRKKIEDDPNKPVHIQTVKGRGIKFVLA